MRALLKSKPGELCFKNSLRVRSMGLEVAAGDQRGPSQ